MREARYEGNLHQEFLGRREEDFSRSARRSAAGGQGRTDSSRRRPDRLFNAGDAIVAIGIERAALTSPDSVGVVGYSYAIVPPSAGPVLLADTGYGGLNGTLRIEDLSQSAQASICPSRGSCCHRRVGPRSGMLCFHDPVTEPRSRDKAGVIGSYVAIDRVGLLLAQMLAPTIRRPRSAGIGRGQRSGALGQNSSQDRCKWCCKLHDLEQIQFLNSTGANQA
jgi:hypothetical protein